jgi:hypothetical protein
MTDDTKAQLLRIHGDGDCYICGKPRIGPGSDICSYPHGMLPTQPADPKHRDGFWHWEYPEPEGSGMYRDQVLSHAKACAKEWWDETARDFRNGEELHLQDINDLLATIVESMPSPDNDTR